jgi:hypothetical protein
MSRRVGGGTRRPARFRGHAHGARPTLRGAVIRLDALHQPRTGRRGRRARGASAHRGRGDPGHGFSLRRRAASCPSARWARGRRIASQWAKALTRRRSAGRPMPTTATSGGTGPSLRPRWSRWRTSSRGNGHSTSAAGPARSRGCWRSGWERTTSPRSIRLSLSSRHAARVCRLRMCASRWPRSFPSPRTSSTWCSPSLSCSSWTTGTGVSARWRASRGRAVSSPPASGTRAPCHCSSRSGTRRWRWRQSRPVRSTRADASAIPRPPTSATYGKHAAWAASPPVRSALRAATRASTTCSHPSRRARATRERPFWPSTKRSSGACAPRSIGCSAANRQGGPLTLTARAWWVGGRVAQPVGRPAGSTS